MVSGTWNRPNCHRACVAEISHALQRCSLSLTKLPGGGAFGQEWGWHRLEGEEPGTENEGRAFLFWGWDFWAKEEGLSLEGAEPQTGRGQSRGVGPRVILRVRQ